MMQGRETAASLLQAEVHEVEHARELAEHNALCARVRAQHRVDLLVQRLELRRALEEREVDAVEDRRLAHARVREWRVRRRRAGAGGVLLGQHGGGGRVEVDGERPLARRARRCADRVVEVLGDADAAERVAAGGADAVLERVVADAADAERAAAAAPAAALLRRRERRRAVGGTVAERRRHGRVGVPAARGTVDDEVRVVDRLAEADEQVEDVRVVVEDRAAVDVPARAAVTRQSPGKSSHRSRIPAVDALSVLATPRHQQQVYAAAITHVQPDYSTLRTARAL
jgi:hypothetical protein